MTASPASAPPTFRTVVYADRDGLPLHLDIFDPVADPQITLLPAPAVLLIHGGGWRNGNRTQFHQHARQLADHGYLAASMQYRLTGEALWPAQLHDCHDALRYLLQRHAELGVDPHRIGAMGSSAGAHLAACLATRDLPDSPVAGVARPACVVDIHGIHHFPHRVYSDKDVMRPLFGGSPEQCPDAYNDASPIHHIDDRTPPLLLTHDPGDRVVPCQQSAEFASALVLAGRRFDFIPTPGSGHGFIYHLDNAWSQQLWPQIMQWLDGHLR